MIKSLTTILYFSLNFILSFLVPSSVIATSLLLQQNTRTEVMYERKHLVWSSRLEFKAFMAGGWQQTGRHGAEQKLRVHM